MLNSMHMQTWPSPITGTDDYLQSELYVTRMYFTKYYYEHSTKIENLSILFVLPLLNKAKWNTTMKFPAEFCRNFLHSSPPSVEIHSIRFVHLQWQDM
mgnify:CR=1 FL=1